MTKRNPINLRKDFPLLLGLESPSELIFLNEYETFVKQKELRFRFQINKITIKELLVIHLNHQKEEKKFFWIFNKKQDRLSFHFKMRKLKVPYYFLDTDAHIPFIYDRLYINFFFCLPPKKVQFDCPLSLKDLHFIPKIPSALLSRLKFSFYFQGDYLDLCIKNMSYKLLIEKLECKKNFIVSPFRFMKRFYWHLFNSFLKKFCL